MVKSISALALLASASTSFAFPAPPAETKTYCLNVWEGEAGDKYSGNCDETENNAKFKKPLLKNGCAEGQIAFTTEKFSHSDTFPIVIAPCVSPNAAQL